MKIAHEDVMPGVKRSKARTVQKNICMFADSLVRGKEKNIRGERKETEREEKGKNRVI